MPLWLCICVFPISAVATCGVGLGLVDGLASAGVSRAHRRVILALRFALVLLIVLALAGWQGVGSLRSVCTVFVLDRSASVSDEGRAAAQQYLQEALRQAPDDARKSVAKPPCSDYTPSIRTPSTCRNFASHSGCASQAGAVTRSPSTTALSGGTSSKRAPASVSSGPTAG